MEFPGFELDMAAFKSARKPEPEKLYDLIILGGGPASMSAAVYAARKTLELAILTKDFGGQMLETSEVENWLGYQSVNAKDLVSRFEEHAKSFDIPIGLGPAAKKVEKDGGRFVVRTDDNKIYQARTIILSTGKRHRHLNVPGEKELSGKGVAYCATCDAPLFRDKKALVAGGGNSAFTTALDLLKVNAEVFLVNYGEGWQADEALVEKVKSLGKARLLENHEVLAIEGKQRVTGVKVHDRLSGEEKVMAADGVFVEIGLLSNSELAADLAALNAAGEVIVDCACRTSVEGLFAAGDVTTVPYKQIVISAGEGAKAALSAYEYLMQKNWI